MKRIRTMKLLMRLKIIRLERLPFHLPGQQQVVYDEDDDIDDVLNKPSVASTKFLAWMDINKTNDLAKTLTYAEFPTKFVKGPTSWDKLYEYDDIMHPSFRDACFAQGLLDDDREYILGLEEIPVFGNLEMRERHIKNLILKDIDAILRKNGSCLSNISSMPLPDLEFLQNHANTLIHDELCYNRDELRIDHENLFSSLTTEQHSRYDQDLAAIDWILKVGDGRLGGPNDGEAMIDIPDDILIKDSPTHEVVEFINDHLLSLLPGKEKVYLSSDSICESEGLNDNFNESLYSPDVLNGMKLAGLPNYRLVLKVRAPVMLLRNIDQSEGLCNGTRLRIKELRDRAIKAEILTGTKVGETVSLFRFKLTPSDKRLPLQINRRQFPISLLFAVSRVTSRKGLKLLAYDKGGNVCSETMNVVYPEVLQKV
ncbi:ATP-dependent DNA helicase PIF1-like protein [Tanacetum coccineum]